MISLNVFLILLSNIEKLRFKWQIYLFMTCKCRIVESLKTHNNLRKKMLMFSEIRGMSIFLFIVHNNSLIN